MCSLPQPNVVENSIMQEIQENNLIAQTEAKLSGYNDILVDTLRLGSAISTGAILFFLLFYIFGGYPLEIVLINVIAFMLSLAVMILSWSRYHHWVLPHILLFAIFLSLSGTAFFSGGISSSSSIWLVFTPIVASLIAGQRGGLIWGIVSMITATTMYLLDDQLTEIALMPVYPLDRLTDLLVMISITIMSIWVNETARRKAWRELVVTRAELHRLAIIDPLTKIYNRRYFFTRVLEILDTPQTAAFLLFDIDHFKPINDQHGHETGDQVLQILCQRVQNTLREKDIFARFGGEEFIIMLPGVDCENAVNIAERIRVNTAQQLFKIKSENLKVTISIGVACHSGILENQTQLEEVLRRADHAMYIAKQSGRNCVKLFQETQISP